MNQWYYLGSVALAGLMCAAAAAQTPTTKPAAAKAASPAGPAFVVTPMRVQELQGAGTFVYVESETTFAGLKETIAKLMKPLDEAMNSGKFQPGSPMIFVYTGVAGDMSKPFTLQIGMPARSSATAAGEIKVRKLEPLRSATLVYSGSVMDIPSAYQQLYTNLFPAGLMPAGENREIYTYWEGPESVNNVVVIQVGVK